MTHYHVHMDRSSIYNTWQLMTEPLDLVGTAGSTSFAGNRDRARYEIYSVEAQAWMDILEFRDWLAEYYMLVKGFGALPTWERHIWDQFRKMLRKPDDKSFGFWLRRILAICYLLRETCAARSELLHVPCSSAG
jgi:hypothetical protein